MDQIIIIAGILLLLGVLIDASGSRNGNGSRRQGGGNGRRQGGGNGRRQGRGRQGRGRQGRRRQGRGNGRRQGRGNGRRQGGGRRQGRGPGGRQGRGPGQRPSGHRQSINIHGSNNFASNTIRIGRGCNNGGGAPLRRAITERVKCDFNILDLNHDGVVPYDEFIKSTSYLTLFDKDELFNIFDNTDGDELITAKEFRIGAQILSNLNMMDQCNFQSIADGPCFY